MQKDWGAFYQKKEAPSAPSSFCEFVLSRNLNGHSLVDAGCGNGRDSEHLAERYQVIGIDPFAPTNEGKRATYQQKNLEDSWNLVKAADIVYSRFFLHAVDWGSVSEIFHLSTGYVCAEARALGDQPLLYPQHERHFIDGNELVQAALGAGHEILFFELGRGLAVYKNEDPLVVRIITKKRELKD